MIHKFESKKKEVAQNQKISLLDELQNAMKQYDDTENSPDFKNNDVKEDRIRPYNPTEKKNISS